MVTGWGWILCQPPELAIADGPAGGLVVAATVGMPLGEVVDKPLGEVVEDLPWARLTWGIAGTAAAMIPAKTPDSKPGIPLAPNLSSYSGIVLRWPRLLALPLTFLHCGLLSSRCSNRSVSASKPRGYRCAGVV